MKHEHFQQLDSTQDYLVNKQPSSEYLVSCDLQLQGKGRQEREWVTIAGAIAFSFYLKPNPTLTLSALEVAVLINEFFNNQLTLKWPNDLIDGQGVKCGGILIDSRDNGLIIGCGINLLPNKEFGSVYQEQILVDTKELPLEIYHYILSHRLDEKSVIERWEKYCSHLNKQVQIENDQGLFIGVGKAGEAILENGPVTKSYFSGSLRIL